MRDRSIAIIVHLITLGASMTCIRAQSNNSLEWGAHEGEEFVYVLQKNIKLDPTGEELVTSQIPLVQQLGD